MVDQRNHGHSFHSNEFNYTVLASDLKNYADAHHLDTFDLIGHSMGGKAAMLFATLYPKYISHLLVADIAPKFYPTHHQTILSGLLSLDFDVLKSRSQTDKQLAKYVSEPSVRQFLLKNLYWKTRERLGLRCNVSVLNKNIEEIGEPLPKNNIFDGKTLFLKGEYSEYVMPNDEPLIKTHFPQAKIQSVAKAGHWLHAQNPDDFMMKSLAFFNE